MTGSMAWGVGGWNTRQLASWISGVLVPPGIQHHNFWPNTEWMSPSHSPVLAQADFPYVCCGSPVLNHNAHDPEVAQVPHVLVTHLEIKAEMK